MRSTVLAVAFSTMSVLACGGDDTTGPQTGNGTPTVASVVVTPNTATLASLSELVTLTASAKDAAGNAISGKTFTWSSSAGSIATVSSSGEVAAVANGSVTITAITDGVSGTATILVDQVGTELEFTVEPTATIAGAVIAPAVQVAIQDVLGSTVTDAADAVTLAILTNPAAGTLSGTTTVNAVGGVATFSDLSIDQPATGYTLSATSGSLSSATRDQFDVLSVVGTYALQTANGSELRAAVITAGSDTVEASRGLLELRDDGTYGFAVFFRTVESGSARVSPQTETGTYAVTGMTIQFSDRTILNNPVVRPDGSDFTGAFAGTNITVTVNVESFGVAVDAEFVFGRCPTIDLQCPNIVVPDVLLHDGRLGVGAWVRF